MDREELMTILPHRDGMLRSTVSSAKKMSRTAFSASPRTHGS